MTRIAGITRRGLLLLAAGAALAPAAPAQTASAASGVAGPAFRMGVVPYLTARTILHIYAGLAHLMEIQLGRPVEVYSASSFRALAEGARAGDPPLTLMPMHLARVAVADWGHTLVARAPEETPTHLVALRSRHLAGAASLRGQRIVTIDPLSATSIVLHRWLREQRLQDSVEIVFAPNMNTAALRLMRGEVDAMALRGTGSDLANLKVDDIEIVAPLPGIMTCWVAHPGVAAADLAAVRRVLLSYTPSAATGQVSPQPSIEGSPHDLDVYEAYAAETRRVLAEPAPR